MILQNVRNYLPNGKELHPRRLGSSAQLLWENLQISHSWLGQDIAVFLTMTLYSCVHTRIPVDVKFSSMFARNWHFQLTTDLVLITSWIFNVQSIWKLTKKASWEGLQFSSLSELPACPLQRKHLNCLILVLFINALIHFISHQLLPASSALLKITSLPWSAKSVTDGLIQSV
jgi:hypothetical protein